MQRRLVGFILAVFLTLSSSGALGAQLTWQVVQPFKFLRFSSDHKIHELAFKQASTHKNFKSHRVSTMENLLNDPVWWKRSDDEEPTPKDIIEKMRKKEARRLPAKFDIRLGWSSLLQSQVGGTIDSGTCWDARAQSYEDCHSDPSDIRGNNEYVNPQHHIVQIEIEGGERCNLRLIEKQGGKGGFLDPVTHARGAELGKIDFECWQPVFARVPFDGHIVIGGQIDGGEISSVTIKVEDFIIASMGDSFASGEGNPDFPATLDPKAVVSPKWDLQGEIVRNVGVPSRKLQPNGKIAKGTSARWVDRRCHRSMYSAHARAAIALALSGDRHHAITFVSTACSGAEITNGMLWPQNGRECTLKKSAGSRYLEPQFGAMVGALGLVPNREEFRKFAVKLDDDDKYHKSHLEVLRRGGPVSVGNANGYCENWPGENKFRYYPSLRSSSIDRKIDILFLGIGGNDMGFAQIVAGAVVTSRLNDNVKGDNNSKLSTFLAGGITPKTALDNLKNLTRRYEILDRAIRSKLEIESTDLKESKDLKKVLLTTYPDAMRSEKGKLCDSGRLGMNVSHLYNLAGPTDGNLKGFLNISEAASIMAKLNEKVRENSSYTIVDSFEEIVSTHGLCAGANDEGQFFDLPYKNKSASVWESFDPTNQYFPYAKRQRWFRTFNDSYLLMQYFQGNANEEKAKGDNANSIYLARRSLGGPMHPTAQAHAAIADSLYCAAAKQILKKQEDAQCD